MIFFASSLKVNGVLVPMCFDTAGDISIITKQIFGKLRDAQLIPCTSAAHDYSNNKIDLLGQAMIQVKQDDVQKFFVLG